MLEKVSYSAHPPGALGRYSAASLVGRRREREVLERLLQSAASGESGVLVVLGEPGVGKTALLDFAIEAAARFRTVRTTGIESEVELPFAATQQLCAPILERRQGLPAPQRLALEVAFGLADGPAPNAFLVGLAILGLLAEAATDRPLLCVVDDAQWLDRASAAALSIVARRLTAENVVLLVAARELGATFAGLPELTVRGLGRTEARTLLETVLSAPVDGQVLDRVVVETGGNPLALLELPRGLSPAQLAGGFGLPAAVPLHASIEERLRPPIQRAMRRSSGGPRNTSVSVSPRRSLPSRKASLSSPRRSRSGIRLCARRCTAWLEPTSGARRIAQSPCRLIRASIRIGGPGTGPRVRRCPTRMSPATSSGPPRGRRRGAALPRPRRSWNARRR